MKLNLQSKWSTEQIPGQPVLTTRTRVEILPQRKNCFKEKGKLVLKGWFVHIVPAKVRESGQSMPGLQRLSIDCSYISLSEERNSNSQSQRKWWYHVYTSEQQSKLCLPGVRRQMELFCQSQLLRSWNTRHPAPLIYSSTTSKQITSTV